MEFADKCNPSIGKGKQVSLNESTPARQGREADVIIKIY